MRNFRRSKLKPCYVFSLHTNERFNGDCCRFLFATISMANSTTNGGTRTALSIQRWREMTSTRRRSSLGPELQLLESPDLVSSSACSVHQSISSLIVDMNRFDLLTGVGIGIVFGSLMQSYARNPSLKNQLFSYSVLGFALAEAMGLFCLMMAFLMLFGL